MWGGAEGSQRRNRRKLCGDKKVLVSILMFIYHFKKSIKEPGTYSWFNPIKP